MRRLFRFFGYSLSALALAVIVLAGATARTADPALWPPKPGEREIEIVVVSHGYHAGLAIPTTQAAAMAQRNGNTALSLIAEQFGSYPFIEVGWGEERFYASVPTPASLSLGIAVRALFQPGNRSVLHVVGLPDHPRKVFASADMVRVPLSERSFSRMLSALDSSVALGGDPPALQGLGRGLYGPSLFFRANGSFHIFNVCNHWVGDMLAAAGLPVTPVLDTVPDGLLLDLKIRAGLDRMPGLQP